MFVSKGGRNHMSDYHPYSRVHKLAKRRKNNRAIIFLMSLGSILVVLFILITVLKHSNEPQTVNNNDADQDPSIQAVNDENDTNQVDIENDEDNQTYDQDLEVHENEPHIPDNDPEGLANGQQHDVTSDEQENQPLEEPVVTQVETNDDLVIEAYTGNWEPIGTVQEEPHVTQFKKETQDWLEMEQAIRYATGLDDMITWRIGNNGEQKVIGTVSTRDQQEIYRVYLSWITNEGWQPTKVERLKELPQRE